MSRVVSSIVGLSSLVVASVASAAYDYDFSSSTEEAQAFTGELGAEGTLIVLGAIASFITIALMLMGAGYVWGKFKKFTGIKKKI